MQSTQQSYVEIDYMQPTFEGQRNIIVCSISRFEEFKRLSDSLSFLSKYDVVCYTWMSHNSVYFVDCEGFASKHDVSIYEGSNEQTLTF